MMQQRIVVDPQAKLLLTDEILQDVSALNVTARHICTLVNTIENLKSDLHTYVSKISGFYESSEWDQIAHFLAMIEEKADHVEAIANRVTASEWHPWNRLPQPSEAK